MGIVLDYQIHTRRRYINRSGLKLAGLRICYMILLPPFLLDFSCSIDALSISRDVIASDKPYTLDPVIV